MVNWVSNTYLVCCYNICIVYSRTSSSWRRRGLKRVPRSDLDYLIQCAFSSFWVVTIGHRTPYNPGVAEEGAVAEGGAGGEGKKKKKKKKKPKKPQQTDPPTVAICDLFPDKNFPEVWAIPQLS